MSRVIAIAGGKGGTGKTFIASNLAYALSKEYRVLLIDADVENPSVQTILKLDVKSIKDSRSFKPLINEEKCQKCGLCSKNCPEHALIMLISGKIMYFEDLCSGCEVCKIVCPSSAITEDAKIDGVFKYGSYGDKLDVVIGEIKPGNRRSGFMTTKLIEEHKHMYERYDYVVIDSPPGSGVALLSIIKHSDVVVAVTEPTPLGLSDLTKFLMLIDKYRKTTLKLIMAINKYDLPGGLSKPLEEIALEKGLPVVRLPYSEAVMKSYSERKPLVDLEPRSSLTQEIIKLSKMVM
ncbi:MAG: P-loop NTPase [Candidatus Nezhaarchaeales archaeon]